MRSKYYMLKDKKVEEVPDYLVWAKWFENFDTSIKITTVNDILVSTVFLSLDHSPASDEPILFETMIFGGDHDGYQKRYSTYNEAVQGHDEICKLAFEGLLTILES